MRLFPWVMQHRQALRDENYPHADEYFDCASCMGRATECQRASLQCGWMSESERTGERPPVPDGCPVQPDICPGYLVGIPAVIEAARAGTWRQDGALREFYDGQPLSDLCKFAVDTVLAESKAVEGYILRKQREEMSNGS